MKSVSLELHQAFDAENSYALRLTSDPLRTWRASKGFGQTFEKAWVVEVQSSTVPPLDHIEWNAMLDRVIEAFSLSDPLLTNFDWPILDTAAPET